ncbi:MAG: prepilin-type N-terminal cleavage/methylation domain-containing protein [Deltaproteobacteria bacterium]|nr:prepilin-type N-terminal cleavage/methylation domain-containing protein [Deltaproteobacteria bacterium]
MGPGLRSAPRSGRRGLTLVESMITAVVLGIGVMGLVSLYGTAGRGVTVSRDQTSALELARQRLERLSTASVDDLPACGGPPSCRQNLSTFANPKGAVGTYPCTQFVDGMDGTAPAVGQASGRFRIDTSIDVPSGSAQQAGALVVTVSVCWSEDGRTIRQLALERMLVPEV